MSTQENSPNAENAKKETIKEIIKSIDGQGVAQVNLIIREDKPEIVYEQQKVSIAGIISSPYEYLLKRIQTINVLDTHVLVDRDKMTIDLFVNASDHFGVTIKGSLEESPIFKKFGINKGIEMQPEKLSDLFKMNRAFFADRNESMLIVSALKNFKAKVNSDIQKSNDNRANTTVLKQQSVTSNLPEGFTLRMPLFKGAESQEFEVEVYINAEDFSCSLISPSANEIIEDVKDGIIDDLIQQIADIEPGIAIIEQ